MDMVYFSMGFFKDESFFIFIPSYNFQTALILLIDGTDHI